MKKYIIFSTIALSIMFAGAIKTQNNELPKRFYEIIGIKPENPTTNDSILVKYYIHDIQTPSILDSSHIEISENLILIDRFYRESPFCKHVEDSLIEFIHIGKLPKGDYTLIITAHVNIQTFFIKKDTLQFKVAEYQGFKNEAKNDFTLYPNPSTNKLKIEGDFGISKVEIITLVGQIVISYATNKQEIDISSIAKGACILLLTDKFGKKHSQKFIKQ